MPPLQDHELRETLFRLYADAGTTLQHIKYVTGLSNNSLKPYYVTHYSNQGVRNDLICLEGTIQMYHQGQVFHAPVKVFLYDSYPASAPMVLINPTAEMQVNSSDSHYDNDGSVHCAYLSQWNRSGSTLAGLVEELSQLFSAISPVFRRDPAASYRPPPQAQQPHQPPSYPAYTQPQSQPTSHTPYHPPQYASPSTTTTATGLGLPSHSGPYGRSPSPYETNQQQQQGSSSYGSTPQNTVTTPNDERDASKSKPSKEEEQELMNHAIRASLVSAVEGKLKRRFEADFTTKEAKMRDMVADEQTIQLGAAQLKQFIQELDREIEQTTRERDELKSRLEDARRLGERCGSADVAVNWDDVVSGNTPLEKQLINLVAEDSAIKDTIAQLSYFLGREEIDVDTYLKDVKILARDQFRLRMLIQKARKVGNLH